jgi:hypothetical protein
VKLPGKPASRAGLKQRRKPKVPKVRCRDPLRISQQFGKSIEWLLIGES